MNTYDEIEEAIEAKDVPRLRNAVTMLAYADPDFSRGLMDEQIQHIESNGIKLKDDELIGDPLISEVKSEFTDDDFPEAVYNLKENFCDDRLNDLKIIAKAVKSKPSNEQNLASNPKPAAPTSAPAPKTKPHEEQKQGGGFAPFVIIAAAIAAIVAIINSFRK